MWLGPARCWCRLEEAFTLTLFVGQRKKIMDLLSDNPSMPHKQLLQMVKDSVAHIKAENELRRQQALAAMHAAQLRAQQQQA
jgi:hypothetical protein